MFSAELGFSFGVATNLRWKESRIRLALPRHQTCHVTCIGPIDTSR